ncbi:MAG: hypothetical protein PVJ47_04665 [Thiohalocapsa sp.]
MGDFLERMGPPPSDTQEARRLLTDYGQMFPNRCWSAFSYALVSG